MVIIHIRAELAALARRGKDEVAKGRDPWWDFHVIVKKHIFRTKKRLIH